MVSFAGNVRTDEGFTTDKDELEDEIDDLSASGGTHTQAGIRQARALLAGSHAQQKVIVLLSDGEPTYSYRIPNVSQKLTRDYFVKDGNRWYTRYDLDPSEFTTQSPSAGNGQSMTTQIQGSYYYHHGHSAIAEATAAKDAGMTIYSIGLTPGTAGPNILNRIASDGRWHAATTGNLTAIFQEIASKIAFAASDATVVDPIAEMFSSPADEVDKIEVSQGTYTYNATTKTITWNVGNVSENDPPYLTYVVEISPEAQSGVVYPTNKTTDVTYTNALGQPARKLFPIPEVGIEAGTIKVHYYRVNAADQPVNSQGVPVGTPADAELHSVTFREDESLELNVPYSVYFSGDDDTVTSIVIDGLYYGYSPAGDQNPTVVTLTTAQPTRHVWFACIPQVPGLSVTGYTGTYEASLITSP